MVSPRSSTESPPRSSTESPMQEVAFSSIVVVDHSAEASGNGLFPQIFTPDAAWNADADTEPDPPCEPYSDCFSDSDSFTKPSGSRSELQLPWDRTQQTTMITKASDTSLRSNTGEHASNLSLGLMSLAVIVPNAVVVVFFSALGFGVDVYNATAKRELSLVGDGFLSGACLLAALLLALDWWRMPRPLKVATGMVPVLLFLAGTPLKARRYPWAPMLLALLFMPFSLFGIRRYISYNVRRHIFFGAVSSMTLLAAVVIFVLWLLYVFDGHRWEQSTVDVLAAQTQEVYNNVYAPRPLVYSKDCAPNSSREGYTEEERSNLEYACAEAGTIWFLIWMCPVVAIGIDLVLATFCFVTGVLGDHSLHARSFQRNLTRFILMMAFILSGIYACATMSATSIRLGSTLMAFFLGALFSVIVWLLTEVDVTALVITAKSSKIMQQMVPMVQSDWMKAMSLCILGPPLVIFFSLNFLCQRCRQCRNAHYELHTDFSDAFTPSARKVINVCQNWNWTSIFVKIQWLCELFFVLQVGVAKITYIFLSWLNALLKKETMGTVVVLVYIVGGGMFLLPPVPGLPVYVFAGILLGEKGRQDENIGFWFGCLIATALGLFTKLCACVGQYMIGYYMGKSVKIQQLIAVDKVPTRAVERILKSRGLNPGKVALLVGGPDWPTSVTCGIIRVNIPQMLLGTLPVIVLLAPCCLAGACMGRVTPGEESEWSMLASTFTAMAAVVNMASMAYAVYTISSTIGKYGEDLSKPRPEHEVVAELTRREASYVACYLRVTQWSVLSCFWKTLLLGGTLLELVSNMMFVCFSEWCFRPFSVSSKIKDGYEKHGLKGSAWNIIIYDPPDPPVGHIVLGLFFLGLVFHIIFHNAMAIRSRQQYLSEGDVLK